MITPETIDERRGATSASNAAADALCPGRHLAQRGLVRVETEYSESGTRIHNALATGNIGELPFAEREIAEKCLEIERAKLIEFFGADDAGKARAFREDPANPERSRLWIRFTGPDQKEYEHSCRVDVVYRLDSKAVIFEYKTLAGEVPESPRNLQLADQQCIIRGNLLIPGDIGVCVIQPLVESNPQICAYTEADSKVRTDQLFARVVASNDPSSPRVAGEVQCKHCLAKTRCKEYGQWSSPLVPALLHVMEVPMDLWTVDQRVAAANALKPAEDLCELIRGFLKDGLTADPKFCPGWKLQPGAKVETITQPQEVFDRFTKLGGKLEQFMAAVKVGKTILREKLSEVTGAKGKSLDKAMKTLTDGLSETKQNAPSLKKDS
jgi:hypothetical protein